MLSGRSAVICLLFCVLGCGRFGGGANSSAGEVPANAEPAKAEKAVDVGSLIGKSVEDVKKALGPPSGEIAGSYKWEFPQGELSLQTDSRTKKVRTIVFSARIFVVGDKVGHGYATYDKLGDLIGFDTRGRTPTSSDEGETGSVRFEKVNLNGKNVDEIRFAKVSGKFITVYVTPERGY